MKKLQGKTLWLVIGIGAIGLYAFWRHRQGLSIFPGFGSALAGQGTAGSTSSNRAFGASGGTLPAVPVQTLTETERLRLRNLATGPLSRGACKILVDGRRWIDTQTPPYYGLCVSQADFTRWMSSGTTLPAGTQPTLDFVKRGLGL